MKRTSNILLRLSVLVILFCALLGACAIGPHDSELGKIEQKSNATCTITLSSSHTSPVTIGTSITITATASCTANTPNISFYLRQPSGAWVKVQDWSNSTTYTWNTTGYSSGTYLVQGWASSDQSSTPFAEGTSPTLSFDLTGDTGNCHTTTLTQNLPSPQLVGTAIPYTFSSICTAGSIPEYKLLTWSGAVIQDWTTSTSFLWDTSTEPSNNYIVYLWVRAKGYTGPNYQAISSYQYMTLNPSSVCTQPTLSASPASPQIEGTPITLSYQSTCTNGQSPLFKVVHFFNGMGNITINDWSLNSSSTWNTTSESLGRHSLTVYVRPQNSTDEYQTTTSIQFDLTAGTGVCTTAALSTSPASPQTHGTPVTFSFSANCNGGKSPEYKLYHKLPSGSWVVAKNWTADSSFTWNTTTELAGNHLFQLWVRAQGSSDAYQVVSATQAFELTATSGTCNTATLTTALTSPQPKGTSITFSFAAGCTGGNGAEYKLYHKDPSGSWSVAKDWTTSTSFAWTTTTEQAGDHIFQLWARTQGSTDTYQALSYSKIFTLSGPAGVCNSATITPTPASPQTQGTSINLSFTANCTGGKTAEYRIWHRLPSGSWQEARGWDSSTSYTWDTSSEAAGSHKLQLWVRAVGSTASSEGISPQITYDLTTP